MKLVLAVFMLCTICPCADLLMGLKRVRVEIRSTLETENSFIKAISPQDLQPFVELALQREGLRVSDSPISEDKDGELSISVFCAQAVQIIACMETMVLKQTVFPVRKNFEVHAKGEVQYTPVVVISKFYSGLSTMGVQHYKASNLQESIGRYLTSFLNEWRKQNPKP